MIAIAPAEARRFGRADVNPNKSQMPQTAHLALRTGEADGKNHGQSCIKTVSISRVRRLRK
jgi:hypothetical protein